MKLSELNEEKMKNLPDEAVARVVYGYREERVPCRAVLLLGGRPVNSEPRAREAAKLYREGLFETAVLCGGVEWDTPFGRLLEADLMARIMLENGVPESAIVYDRQSTTTRENMLFGAVELGRRFRRDPPHEVGIYTSPCHLRRSAALAEVYLPRIYRSCPVALPTPFDSPEEWTHDAFRAERVRHEAELLRRLVRTGVIPDIEF